MNSNPWVCEALLANGLTVEFHYTPDNLNIRPIQHEEFEILSVKDESGASVDIDDRLVIDMLKAAQKKEFEDERNYELPEIQSR